MARIQLRDVTFHHARTGEPALAGLCLEIGEGVTGIVGPNGAGKTTLFRVLLGALTPRAGTVRIDDVVPAAYRTRHPIGFLPERPAFAPYLTVRELLYGLAAVSGPAPTEVTDALAPLLDRRLGSLSLGETRRVEIAAALCGDPDLLLLDEPTNGLDPLAVGWLRTAIERARRRGRAILIASHHLDELQRMVDQVVVLRGGAVAGVWPRATALSEFGSFETLFQARVGDEPVPLEVR